MKKILIIDDNKNNLTTIRSIIESHMSDCEVLCALSGKEGIKMAKEEVPDTILLDIIMPEMDGYEVCKELKEDTLTRHIPILMLTALAPPKESRIKSLNGGADAFFSKPIDSEELAAQVNVMLRIKEAEDKLRADKQQMEDRIKDRTIELDEQNNRLQLEISARKQMEKELVKAKEKAEESDRLKTAFLSNLSHEIRTPLNGILGFAQLLKETDLADEDYQEYVLIMEKSGARMLNIINDLVHIAKIESGQVEFDLSEENINERLDKIYSLFKFEAEAKNIELQIKSPLPLKDGILVTDHDKLNAILTKLVSNAIKFTQSGSVEFGYELKGKSLEFFIKDTGEGIPKEKQDIIFDRFRQGTELHSKKYEGAGLGLSISKALVEMLGGSIWLKSDVGKGSTFSFTIPYKTETVGATDLHQIPYETDDTSPINEMTMLIVEDDKLAEMFLSIVVKPFCKEILKVRTGAEAVEICRNNPSVDLVLMDINLPGMNGYEAVRQIREFNKVVVIIAETAYALIGDRDKAIEAGCNDYISKPINKKLLKELIQKHCQS